MLDRTPHERVQAAVAALTGFRPDQIVFQPNTSQGLMHAMFGITGGVALSAAEPYTIAVIPKGTTHEFWKSVHAGAVKASKELDVDVVWKGPLKEDDLKAQISKQEELLEKQAEENRKFQQEILTALKELQTSVSYLHGRHAAPANVPGGPITQGRLRPPEGGLGGLKP